MGLYIWVQGPEKPAGEYVRSLVLEDAVSGHVFDRGIVRTT
jgi:hypothetical protein